MSRIERLIRQLTDMQWIESRKLEAWTIKRGHYIQPEQYNWKDQFNMVHPEAALNNESTTTYLLQSTIEIPEAWIVDDVGLLFESSGEGLLRINGNSYHGLDINHSFVPIHPHKVGYSPKLEIELMDPEPIPYDPLNQQFGPPRLPISTISCQLVLVNRPIRNLLYTISTAAEAVELLPEKSLEKDRLMKALYKVLDAWVYLSENARNDRTGLIDGDELVKLDQLLLEALSYDAAGVKSGVIHMVAQSHIDIAWLWPVRETVRKGSRTFSTALQLMEEFPEYHYAQSQPQLYAYVKEHDPELYSRVKEQIASGRWELVGGMWVEPDLNIPSGESLVRQNLYGQKFYMDEFGKRSVIEWLPDTFGYCASLPQILKLSGVEYFMTSKLNWSDTNYFPYDLFHWVGIDGTAILSYLNHGLGENTKPKDIKEHWDSFRQKTLHHEQMMLYGHGDGGGGATREMVEQVARASRLPGLPVSKFSTAEAYFQGLEGVTDRLPKWYGDLYLEYHRGTYTTQARNKMLNRKMELLYREAEIWRSLANVIEGNSDGSDTASCSLEEGWKLILLNQFHDIIPGSSITEVYETSTSEYTEVNRIGTNALSSGLELISSKVDTEGEGTPYLVFNSLGWERDVILEIPIKAGSTAIVVDHDGNLFESQIVDGDNKRSLVIAVTGVPAFGYKTIWLQTPTIELSGYEAKLVKQSTAVQPTCWETELYVLEFNECGEIVRWLDKEEHRELLKAGTVANELQFFHDKPIEWDAWDLDDRYAEQPAGKAKLEDFQVIENGSVRDVLRFRWSWSRSSIVQDLIIHHGKRRVDFKTSVDWQEEHKLWKVAFPVDLVATKATYEIPFGALERSATNNTSWDQAQYEVCGHRWADVSEGSYGVSLMNDSKYGYDIKENTLRLSLLRAPKWPDCHADLGHHDFTYSLYPHSGNWRDAHVVRVAAELNQAATVRETTANKGVLPPSDCYVELHSNHVILDTIKPSEDGNGTILRLYESSGSREQIRLCWRFSVAKAWIVNLLEEEIEEVPCCSNEMVIEFRPYEIKTLRIITASPK